jgi:hypothetical protein
MPLTTSVTPGGANSYNNLLTTSAAEYVKKTFADAITTHTVYIRLLLDEDLRGRAQMNPRPVGPSRVNMDGESIEAPIEYALGTSQRINGDTTLSTTGREFLTKAVYEWKEYVSPPIVQTKRERNLNAGTGREFNLLQAKIDNSMKSLLEDMETDMFGSSTGNYMHGLQLLAEDSPSSTVGQIDSSTYTWWQNQNYTTAVGTFGTSQAGFEAFRDIYDDLVRGSDKPDLMVTTQTIHGYWRRFASASGTFNILENRSLVDMVPDAVNFLNCPIIWSSACAASHAYAINTRYDIMCVKPNQDMVLVGEARQFDSLKYANWVYIMANHITTNRYYAYSVATSITGY